MSTFLTHSSCGRRCGAGLFAALLLATAPASAEVYHVNVNTGSNVYEGSVSAPWKTMTYALTQVVSNDTVEVAVGTYSPSSGETFPLAIPAGVTLRGEDLFRTVIAVNGPVGAVNLFDAHAAVFERFTITGITDGDNARGVRVQSSAPTIRDVRIKGNQGRSGGFAIIVANNASPLIRNCLIHANNSSGGGGIRVESGTPVIENCTILGNWPNGISRSGGTPIIRDSIIWKNRDNFAGVTAANSSVTNSLIGDGILNGTNGCFSLDPLFVGGYFLAQTAAGQAADSPALNAGSRTAAAAGMAAYTSRTDGQNDDGMADLGFHYVGGTTSGVPVFVRMDGSDTTGDGSVGTPWRTVTKALQSAIYGTVVNVSTGFYRAGETFPLAIPDGVSLKGGDFPRTILSRGANGQVVSLSDVGYGVLDGFTVADGGDADNSCGIMVFRSVATIHNCRVTRNSGRNGAGGIRVRDGSQARLENLLIVGNWGSGSGAGRAGIAVSSSRPQILHCTIIGNYCPSAVPSGIYFTYAAADSVVRDCIVWGHPGGDLQGVTAAMISHSLVGDGQFNTTNHCFQADPLFTRGYYLSRTATGQSANSPALAAGSGDAAALGRDSGTTRTDGAAASGTADLGFHHPAGDAVGATYFVNVTSGSNTANDGLSAGAPFKTLTHALAQAQLGSVIHVAAGTFSSANETLPLKPPDGVEIRGAGYTNTIFNLAGKSCAFEIDGVIMGLIEGFTMRNSADGDFSGGCYLWRSAPTIQNCRMTENQGRRHAGGITATQGSRPTLRNCLIDRNWNNTASATGGGIVLDSWDATVENCTIISNNIGRTIAGGGIALRSGRAAIRNCLVRGHSDDISGVTAAMLSHCHVGDGEFDGVNACFATAPQFVDLAARDYRLAETSPSCLNAGLNQPWMDAAYDLAGQARRANRHVDVGAFETWLPPAATVLLVR